ncbi:MAG: putative porin, partial [Candidatus Omnitrophota bacterium]
TIDQQNQKIGQLEKRGPQVQMAQPSTESSAAPMSDYEFNERLGSSLGGANKWLKDLKFSGDLRLRYEAFAYSAGSTAETDARNRFRYRLRFGFEKKITDEIDVKFGLASGEGPTTEGATAGSAAVNSDPTSTNTSFDNNFNFKPIYIEKAYAKYSPKFAANKGFLGKTEIAAGKVDNPFEKGSSDMIWDRDVKPEGVYEKFDFNLFKTEDIEMKGYALFGQFVLDEDASTRGDANLFAYQGGLNPVIYTPFLERPVDLLSAVSFYQYDNYARNNNFVVGGKSLARGNPNYAENVSTELDASSFQVVESYSELAFYPNGLPVRPFMDYAWNPSDSAGKGILNQDFSYGLGVKLGGLNKKGDWELLTQYKYIAANSVVGAFNDSDFGDGHSGKRGAVFKAAYALADNMFLNGAMFFVENLNSGTGGIIDQQQRRFQVDMSWKF